MPSNTEQLTRDLFLHYLPLFSQRHGERPNWLKSPKTGRNLELDIQLPELGLAIEVQGIQHGRYTPGLQRDFDEFVDQQARDAWKRQKCLDRGIAFYSLDIRQPQQERFEPFILELMKQHGLYD